MTAWEDNGPTDLTNGVLLLPLPPRHHPPQRLARTHGHPRPPQVHPPRSGCTGSNASSAPDSRRSDGHRLRQDRLDQVEIAPDGRAHSGAGQVHAELDHTVDLSASIRSASSHNEPTWARSRSPDGWVRPPSDPTPVALPAAATPAEPAHHVQRSNGVRQQGRADVGIGTCGVFAGPHQHRPERAALRDGHFQRRSRSRLGGRRLVVIGTPPPGGSGAVAPDRASRTTERSGRAAVDRGTHSQSTPCGPYSPGKNDVRNAPPAGAFWGASVSSVGNAQAGHETSARGRSSRAHRWWAGKGLRRWRPATRRPPRR